MRLVTKLSSLDNIEDGETRKLINYTAGDGINITDGVISATGGGTGGTSDHSKLTNLDYDSSGHTGFAGTGVANTFTEIQTFGPLKWSNNDDVDFFLYPHFVSDGESSLQISSNRKDKDNPNLSVEEILFSISSKEGDIETWGDITPRGNINLLSSNMIYWKEIGYGNKFAIIPQFGSENGNSFLNIRGNTGGAGTDPDLYDLVTISGDGGDVSISGSLSVGLGLKVAMFGRNRTDTWVPVIGDEGAIDYTLRKIVSSVTHSDYPNDQDRLATLSMLSYWNGAYNSSGSSNLDRCARGKIIGESDMYHKSGDTYSISSLYSNVGGCLTSAKKQVRFAVFTLKSLANISSITVNAATLTIRNTAGNYILDASSVTSSVTAQKAGDNCIYLVYIASTAMAGTNNTPVAIEINKLTLTFK